MRRIAGAILIASLGACCGAEAERQDPKATEEKVIEAVMAMYQASSRRTCPRSGGT